MKLKVEELGVGNERNLSCAYVGVGMGVEAGATVKFHPANYATATEEVTGVQFHRFNCTLPGFVVKCTNMPLILLLKYYIC